MRNASGDAARVALVLCVTVLLCSWSVSRYHQYGLFETETSELAGTSAEEDTLLLSQHLELADFHAFRRLPPSSGTAETHLKEALRFGPLKSETWITLSRLRLFQGDVDASAEALRFADSLDPGYPAQRLAASRQWYLLGENERAAELARGVASWGGGSIAAAAGSLRQSGLSPAESWSVVEQSIETDDELIATLTELQSTSPEAMAELWVEVSSRMRMENASLRKALSDIFSRPVVWPAIESLWRAQASREIRSIAIGEQELLIQNPRLQHPVSAEELPFGWQRLRKSNLSLQQHGDILEMRLLSDGRNTPSAVAWNFYRLPVPPLDVPVKITVRVRSESANSCRLTLIAYSESGTVRSSPVDGKTFEWTTLSIELPSSPFSRLVSLQLYRQRQAGTSPGSASVALRDLRILETRAP